MTLDTKRLEVLLALLRESLPANTLLPELNVIERFILGRPQFTEEQYAKIPTSVIVLWNCGSKVQAIKACRVHNIFPELGLLELKQLLETHPKTQ